MVRGAIHNASFVSLLLCCFAVISHSTRPSLQAVGKSSNDDSSCVYTVYVRTGSIWKAGTDSIISLALAGDDGSRIVIEDLESYGLMGPNHHYFERGNLDIFSGRGPCISSWPCWMNLTSDGSGPHHGWYCKYVQVSVTGLHKGCAQQMFEVEQWLALDASPYRLYATVDVCNNADFVGEDDGDAGNAEIASGAHVARDV